MKRRIGIRETLAGWAMWAPLGVVRLLPPRWRGSFLGALICSGPAHLAGYGHRIGDNLRAVWPGLGAAQVRALQRAVLREFGRNLAELVSPQDLRRRAQAAPVTGVGVDDLVRAVRDGRPVVFVTGHFGSFNAARLAMVARGFDLGVLYRPMHNRVFNRLYERAMARLSTPMFAQGLGGVRQLVQHLRRGGAVAIVADMRAADGVVLEFLGRPAMTSCLPADLALRTGALLVPVWGIRTGRGFEIRVELPIEHSTPDEMMQAFNDRLGAQVTQRPEQWFWVHRRWTGVPDQA